MVGPGDGAMPVSCETAGTATELGGTGLPAELLCIGAGAFGGIVDVELSPPSDAALTVDAAVIAAVSALNGGIEV